MFDNDDDINSSGLGPTNESSSLVRGLQEIAEHDVKHRSAAERELRRKAKFYKNLSNIPEDLVKKLGYGSHKKTKALLSSTKSKLMNSIESMLERENIRASKISEKAFSETAMNSMIRSDELSSSITQGTSYFEESTWGSMTSRQDELLKRLSSVRNEARNISKSIFSQSTVTRPENLGREDIYENLRQLEGEKRSIAIEYGAIERQKSIRKQMGTDPSSREQAMYGYLNEAREKGFAEEILKQQAVSINEGAGKKSVSFSELSNELDQQLKLLTEDFKRLSEATADQREAIQQEVDKRVENIQTLEKAENIADGNAGSGQNNIKRLATGLNIASSMFNAGSNLISTLGISQPMQRVANVSTAAGMANDQYDLYKRARAGDVHAQMQLMTLHQGEAYAKDISFYTNMSQGAGLVGSGLQVGAGGVQATSGVLKYLKADPDGTKDILEGGNNIASGLTSGVILANDMFNQTTATTNKLAARRQAQGVNAQLTQIPAEQIQTLRDFYIGMGQVGLGLGQNKRNQMFDEMAGLSSTPGGIKIQGQGILEKMKDLNMSPKQLIELSQFGAQNIGSTFDVNQSLGAIGLERSGIGTAAGHMQSMAALAQAGSQNPQTGLASVLSAAVTHGIDNAKNMTAMAENTAALVSRSGATAYGIDTTGFIAAELGAGLGKTGTEETKIRSSMTNLEAAQAGATNISNSLSGYMNTAGIMSSLGVSGEHASYLGRMEISDVKAMIGATGEEKRKLLRDAGINEDQAKKLLKQKQIAALRGSGGILLSSDKVFSAVVDALELPSGEEATKELTKKLTKEEFALVNQQLGSGGFVGPAEQKFGTLIGVGNPNEAPVDDKIKKGLEGKGGDDLTKSLVTLTNSGLQQMTAQALSAAEQMGGFTKALSEFVKAQEEVNKDSVKREEEFSGLAEKMGKDFSAGVTGFNTGVASFVAASTALASAYKVDKADIEKELAKINGQIKSLGVKQTQ